MKRQHGFTLAELMLFVGLLSLLLTTMYLVLSLLLRDALYNEMSTAAQLAANASVGRLTSDLNEANFQTLVYDASNPTYVIFLSPQTATTANGIDFDPQGKLMWQSWICWYFDKLSTSLFRAQMNFPTPSSQLPAPPYPLLSSFDTAPCRAMANNVLNFTVSVNTYIYLDVAFGDASALNAQNFQGQRSALEVYDVVRVNN